MGTVSELVGVVVFLVAGSVVLRGLEWAFHARPMTKLLGRERLTDVAHVVFNQIVTRPIVRLLGLATFVAFVLVFRLPHDPSRLYDVWHRDARLASLPVLVQAPLAIVFADLTGYWVHRALHHGRLWRFHAVHHSSRALDWLAGARNHPVAEAFTTVVTAAVVLLVGFDARVLAVAAPLGLYAVLLHANVAWPRRVPSAFRWLRYVITTPHFHRWHHAGPDALPEELPSGVNFANLLPIWDLLFGTFHLPQSQPTSFGADVPVPAGFGAQLVFPFRR
jgi:sterol desaturase/sphingolipid hydroxylase (fatty acid hydroxylase superfamily)